MADVSIKGNRASLARENPHCSKLFSGSKATLALCENFHSADRMTIRMCSMRCGQAESSEFTYGCSIQFYSPMYTYLHMGCDSDAGPKAEAVRGTSIQLYALCLVRCYNSARYH